eukprot:c20491_g1_i1.p1 GENE.c20491_g1_i1~~c20491_g1_i1.p1  ORF type:complete len:1085 (+),score=424.14 c20491_g1_i1:187-3441(+)
MERLLYFEQGVDIQLLDDINQKMNFGTPQERAQAQSVLTQFRDHPDSWITVDKILASDCSTLTKYFALQILEQAIKFRWKILPEIQKKGIKVFILDKVVTLAQDPLFIQNPDQNVARMNRLYLSKLDLVVVAIIKQEWPSHWQTFIPDIVNISKTSELLCENNMNILKLLSEEIFEFGSSTMTQAKTKELKEAYTNEFSQIFELCDYVLRASNSPKLISATLQTLLRFLNWIPLGYIFETTLIETLAQKYFPFPEFRVDAIKCLIEIGTLDVGNIYRQKVVILYNGFMNIVKNAHIGVIRNIKKQWKDFSEEASNFVQSLALFFSGFLKTHLHIIEVESPTLLIEGIEMLVEISKSGDWEILKISLDFYQALALDLYQSEVQELVHSKSSPEIRHERSARWTLYNNALSNIRRVIIENMAKPEEVLIVENDDGQIVREFIKDSDVIVVYQNMREALVYLTHLNPQDTENIMLDKLCRQMDYSEWSWNNLNTLCWAIGSISGAFDEESEKKFLVSVIRDLLNLTDMKLGKDNKAVIASNIMYVVGQYPRFLRAHWKFLKTVVNKLFEFMHEFHPGVQDMACDTFLKIASKCQNQFVIIQARESTSFVDDLLKEAIILEPITAHSQPPFTLGQVILNLQPHQIQQVYEGVAIMISALSSENIEQQRLKQSLIPRLMSIPNNTWMGLLQQNSVNPKFLFETETSQQITHILRTNIRVCTTLGEDFRNQLMGLYQPMLHLYKVYSEQISSSIISHGVIAAQHSDVRSFKTTKVEILKLIGAFVDKATDVNFVYQTILPPLVDPVLDDYSRGVPQARNPEVLSLFSAIVTKTQKLLLPALPKIFSAVFECTLQMITQNFEDYPEHRTHFFNFLKSVSQYCFEVFLQMSSGQFKLIVDSICWACKHTDRVNSELGLEILQIFLEQVEQNPQFMSVCYQQHFVTILQEVFYILLDTFHKSGFKQQAKILMYMFSVVETNKLSTPIFDRSQHPNILSNKEFLRQHIINLLSSSFPNLMRYQVETFVDSLFNSCNDSNQFKNQLRDFLVQLKEWSNQDNNELYHDETQAQIAQQKRLAVPGLVPGAHENRMFE